MERSVEERLFAITDGIQMLLGEARAIINDLGDEATTPYWDVRLHLADAGRACCEAISIEREREASHA